MENTFDNLMCKWSPVERYVKKAIHNALQGCPVDHRIAVFDEVKSSFMRAALVRPEENPIALARRITTWRIADYWRDRYNRETTPMSLLEGALQVATVDMELETAEIMTAVRQQLSMFDDPIKAALFLEYLDGEKRPEQIATIFGVSLATFYRWKSEVQAYLRATLGTDMLA